MGKVILWPATQQALHRADGQTAGYDLTGATILDVPENFTWHGQRVDWDTMSLTEDLRAIKAAKRDAACALAEEVRTRFLTPGSGQAITYTRKEGEARAWHSGGDLAAAPFLAAEAAATGMAMDDLAALVIAQADAWVAVGSAIEARRRGLLVAIDEATTREQLDEIDIAAGWPGVPA